jgi:hypothetical protein
MVTRTAPTVEHYSFRTSLIIVAFFALVIFSYSMEQRMEKRIAPAQQVVEIDYN